MLLAGVKPDIEQSNSPTVSPKPGSRDISRSNTVLQLGGGTLTGQNSADTLGAHTMVSV